MRRVINKALRVFGSEIVPLRESCPYPRDFTSDDIYAFEAVKAYTMTGAERVLSLLESVRHIVRCGIEGSIVECGVWRGGSMMAVALELVSLEQTHLNLYLFDTFAGMTEPGESDIDYTGRSAASQFKRLKNRNGGSEWCHASLEDVERNMWLTGYPMERVHFMQVNVEDTIPDASPDQIALLRLDTDWYASTLHELQHLYPRLSVGGVLIIDDYGYWRGCREAVEKYFRNSCSIFLHRIDETGRIGIKRTAGRTT